MNNGKILTAIFFAALTNVNAQGATQNRIGCIRLRLMLHKTEMVTWGKTFDQQDENPRMVRLICFWRGAEHLPKTSMPGPYPNKDLKSVFLNFYKCEEIDSLYRSFTIYHRTTVLKGHHVQK